jgi:hypothetical protein
VVILKSGLIAVREALDSEVNHIPYSGVVRYAHFSRERV